MKKLFALVAVALIGAAGVFAFSIGEVQGTWRDAEWDANWTFSTNTAGEGQVVLTKASTGETIYTFTDGNTSGYDLSTGVSGITISFRCKDTGRSYKFTKPISLSTDLTLDIDRDWTDEPYVKSITYVSGGASAN